MPGWCADGDPGPGGSSRGASLVPAAAAPVAARQRWHPSWVQRLEPGGAASTPAPLPFTDTTKIVIALWGISD